jgi:hypothetical protein
LQCVQRAWLSCCASNTPVRWLGSFIARLFFL